MPFGAAERLCPILPLRQCACRILRRAALSDLPATFGTMHSSFRRKRAVADRACFIVSAQLLWALAHAPDQPLKAEPLADVATRVTFVPYR